MEQNNRGIFAYNHSMMTVIQSHYCKETPIGPLQAEKIVEAVLRCVFKTAIPLSLFDVLNIEIQMHGQKLLANLFRGYM